MNQFTALASRAPWTKAEWFVIINLFIIIVFGIYYTVKLWDEDTRESHFNVPDGERKELSAGEKILNGLYHSIITHTSVGFGDYSPKSDEAKLVVMTHVLIMFFANLWVGLL